jgi:hypothetical protein
MPDIALGGEQTCYDPGCPGTAIPEEDGLMQWWACPECGYEFGYEAIPQAAGACSLGVPAQVRSRAAALPPEPGAPVFLGQIGRRPSGE